MRFDAEVCNRFVKISYNGCVQAKARQIKYKCLEYERKMKKEKTNEKLVRIAFACTLLQVGTLSG